MGLVGRRDRRHRRRQARDRARRRPLRPRRLGGDPRPRDRGRQRRPLSAARPRRLGEACRGRGSAGDARPSSSSTIRPSSASMLTPVLKAAGYKVAAAASAEQAMALLALRARARHRRHRHRDAGHERLRPRRGAAPDPRLGSPAGHRAVVGRRRREAIERARTARASPSSSRSSIAAASSPRLPRRRPDRRGRMIAANRNLRARRLPRRPAGQRIRHRHGRRPDVRPCRSTACTTSSSPAR